MRDQLETPVRKEPKAPLARRLIWFFALWTLGVVTVTALAYLIRALMAT